MFSVICLCYNQERFVRQALDSVIAQQYPGPVQLIIVDDASTDGSRSEIENWLKQTGYPCQTLFLPKNLGNCRAFNLGLLEAGGQFVIDLAGDDQLAPGRLDAHARAFLEDDRCLMVYGDAWYLDQVGRKLYLQSTRVGGEPPEGSIFSRLFQGNFICPSTVTFRTEALMATGGYDERLAFEDFDIWMRLARLGTIRYVPKVASCHRVSSGSLSGRFYKSDQPKMPRSIVLIGTKALALALNHEERESIAGWLRFQARLAAYLGYPVELKALALLFQQATGKMLPNCAFWKLVARIKPEWLYRLYLRLRYQK